MEKKIRNIVIVSAGVTFTTNEVAEIWPTMQMLISLGHTPEITNVSWGAL